MAKRNVTLHDKYKSTTALYPKIDVKSLTPDAITEITRITEVVVEEQVVPNPTPTGEEPNLEYITINNVTYKVPTGSGQVQSNWNETDTDSPAYIQNKPTIPSAQVQANWNENDNNSPAYIQNKPTIPSAQVQSNWNETDTDSPAYIQNKPTIPSVIDLAIDQTDTKKSIDITTVVTNGCIVCATCEATGTYGSGCFTATLLINNFTIDCVCAGAGSTNISIIYNSNFKTLQCSVVSGSWTNLHFTDIKILHKW